MGLFDGKVAVVTGSGRGIGRSEALLLAREGAKVVVNDLGGSGAGEGSDQTPAQQVVDEIKAAGGDGVANYDDCSSWSGAEGMIDQAIETFGGLDVLICNAGILRDKMSFNMTEEEFDSVIRVHLKGHFAPSHFAGAYWRQKAKETGEPGDARDRHDLVGGRPLRQRRAGELRRRQGRDRVDDDRAARELERSGVRVNAIAPVAATRLLGTVGAGEELADNPGCHRRIRPRARCGSPHHWPRASPARC